MTRYTVEVVGEVLFAALLFTFLFSGDIQRGCNYRECVRSHSHQECRK